ncbi:MAG TPA: VOC family protein [Burkholderiales bacterium]|nr:VOC family protein [Burkholderiales bacterium]
MQHQLRIARPVSDLPRAKSMYCAGLGLRVLGSFEDHEGFDGAVLGRSGLGYHFEFTHCRAQAVRPSPTSEDLTVFYVPDTAEWEGACADMLSAGFVQVTSFNPYWDIFGRTFEDQDGYRVVLQNTEWESACAE